MRFAMHSPGVRALVLVLAAWLVAGCGHAPAPRTEEQERAIELNRRAQSALESGEHRLALELYRQALAVNHAMEDVDGIARELANVATLHRKLGEKQQARTALEQMLAPAGIPFTSSHRAEAMYRLAAGAFEDGDDKAAREWSEKALALCAGPGCAAEGALRNFRAGLALRENDAASAFAQARAALELNRRARDGAEEANSLRLMADAQLRLGDAAGALAAYLQAFELDRAAGAGRKIALDLMGLGHASARRGSPAEAEGYFRRALAVYEGVNDNAGVEAARRALARP